MMQMTIVVDDNGNINVNGPIDNPVAAYGMLEIARDAIQQHNAKKNASPIVPPSNGDILAFRKP